MLTRVDLPGGVAIEPAPPSANASCVISYYGLLAKSGASRVFAKVGYGDNWHNAREFEMRWVGDTFETQFKVDSADTMHICFRDSLDNWDNNNGSNWTAPVNSEWINIYHRY